jgi:hypothetical protein
VIDHAEPYPEMPDNLPPLPPKWSAPLSLTCACPTVSGGPMAVPECPIHAGPFGREVVKLRGKVTQLEMENRELRHANNRWIAANEDLDAVVSATIRVLRERKFVA